MQKKEIYLTKRSNRDGEKEAILCNDEQCCSGTMTKKMSFWRLLEIYHTATFYPPFMKLLQITGFIILCISLTVIVLHSSIYIDKLSFSYDSKSHLPCVDVIFYQYQKGCIFSSCNHTIKENSLINCPFKEYLENISTELICE